MIGRLGFLFLFGIVGVALPSATRASESQDACGDADPRVSIAACTEIIQTVTAAYPLSKAYTNRGFAFGRKGLYERAIKDYDHAIAQDQSNAVAFNNRCYALGQKEELERALSDCQMALKLQPRNPAILDSRAFIYLKMGKYSEAIQDYNDAVGILPTLATSLYGRGVAKLRTGDPAGAALDIKAAKAIDANVVVELAVSGLIIDGAASAVRQLPGAERGIRQ